MEVIQNRKAQENRTHPLLRDRCHAQIRLRIYKHVWEDVHIGLQELPNSTMLAIFPTGSLMMVNGMFSRETHPVFWRSVTLDFTDNSLSQTRILRPSARLHDSVGVIGALLIRSVVLWNGVFPPAYVKPSSFYTDLHWLGLRRIRMTATLQRDIQQPKQLISRLLDLRAKFPDVKGFELEVTVLGEALVDVVHEFEDIAQHLTLTRRPREQVVFTGFDTTHTQHSKLVFRVEKGYQQSRQWSSLRASNFLALPKEARLRIYHYVFSGSQICPQSSTAPHRLDIFPTASLLLVNSQVYTEVQPIFWKSATIDLASIGEAVDYPLKPNTAWKAKVLSMETTFGLGLLRIDDRHLRIAPPSNRNPISVLTELRHLGLRRLRIVVNTSNGYSGLHELFTKAVRVRKLLPEVERFEVEIAISGLCNSLEELKVASDKQQWVNQYGENIVFVGFEPSEDVSAVGGAVVFMIDKHQRTRKPLHFLTLPVEIRLHIYHFVFKDARIWNNERIVTTNGRELRSFRLAMIPAASLVFVNRLVYREASPIFWELMALHTVAYCQQIRGPALTLGRRRTLQRPRIWCALNLPTIDRATLVEGVYGNILCDRIRQMQTSLDSDTFDQVLSIRKSLSGTDQIAVLGIEGRNSPFQRIELLEIEEAERGKVGQLFAYLDKNPSSPCSTENIVSTISVGKIEPVV